MGKKLIRGNLVYIALCLLIVGSVVLGIWETYSSNKEKKCAYLKERGSTLLLQYIKSDNQAVQDVLKSNMDSIAKEVEKTCD